MTNLDSILKSRGIGNKGPSSQSYSFSSSHVWIWELDYKSWAPKNWCFWTMALEKTLESPLDCKIKPVNPKWNQSWIFIGRTDAEAPILLTTWWDKLTHLKRPWCWKRLKEGREGDYSRWGGWMASLTQWTWVWANPRSWWWTGKHGMLQSIGLQESDTTEQLNWTDVFSKC